MRRSVIAACVLAVALTGCAALESALEPAVYVNLDIHNRTLDPLVFENADGQRVEVPACYSVRVEGFSLDTVNVRAPDGYVRAFGAADGAFAGQEMHLIELASAAASGIPVLGPAPANLPPCEDHAEAQPGT